MASIAQISGLGRAGLTRTDPASPDALAVAAIDDAIANAGLTPQRIDGLLISRSGNATEPNLLLYAQTGLPALKLLQLVEGEGTSAIQMIHTASMAVASGVARHVVCVFSDAPLRGGVSGRDAFTKAKEVTGIGSLRYSAGAAGGTANYALAASRYLHQHGVGERELGAVAVSTREWACLNPRAVMRKPLTMEDYLASRPIVAPLRLFDCALPVNGGIAVVVSASDHQGDGVQVPVHIHAIAQGHAPKGNAFNVWERAHVADAARRAYAQAGVSARDVGVREFYDAFTVLTLFALEDYGFCERGQAGELAVAGALGPGGAMPTNTGGGLLSCYYMQGMTPVEEAILQAAGAAGERQCEQHDVVLATNEGGWIDFHACMILSRHARLN